MLIKYPITVFYLLALLFNSSSQDTDYYEHKNSNYHFGLNLFFTPGIAYRKISDSRTSYLRIIGENSKVVIYENNDIYDKPKFGFCTGIDLVTTWNLNKKKTKSISLNTGFSYDNLGFKNNVKDKAIISVNNGQTSTFDTCVDCVKSRFNARFISMNILVGYSFTKGKYGVKIETGCALAGFYQLTEVDLRNRTKYFLRSEREYPDINGSSGYLFYVANVEFRIHVKDKLSLTLGPTFRYGLTPTHLTYYSLLTYKPFFIGFKIGIYIKLMRNPPLK